MTELLLFPFGGNAREAYLSVLAQNRIKQTWHVQGFIDDDKALWGKQYCRIKVVGGREMLSSFPSAQILAVPGNPGNFLTRDKIIGLLGIPEARFATIIHPTAHLAPDSRVGINTLLMVNVIASCAVVIGNHCVVLPNTVISHDSCIGDYSVIGSNVSISGSCTIGSSCYIGSGTRIKEHVTIGAECLVGIGSCVLTDVPDKTVVVGNPARFLRKVE